MIDNELAQIFRTVKFLSGEPRHPHVAVIAEDEPPSGGSRIELADVYTVEGVFHQKAEKLFPLPERLLCILALRDVELCRKTVNDFAVMVKDGVNIQEHIHDFSLLCDDLQFFVSKFALFLPLFQEPLCFRAR